MKNVFLMSTHYTVAMVATIRLGSTFHERIDQPSPTVKYSTLHNTTYTSLQHPTTVLLFHVYHIYTQQLFNFQKIIFLLLPPPSRGPNTGLSVNV